MTIQELQGKEIKISKSSITAKMNGKTCGVIRNIKRLSEMCPRQQFDIHSKLRKNGINAISAGLQNIVISGEDIYYIVAEGTKKEFCEQFKAAGYTVITGTM